MWVHRNVGGAAVALGLLTLAAGQASAAGFAIKEQSGAALGNAFAGVSAGAHDLSDMFFNSAALALQSGSQVVAIGSYIAPQAELKGGAATTILTGSIGGGNGGGDIADDALVPALYGMWDLSDRVKLGIGVTAPWGLSTNYNANWIGRYHALKSELKTININPVVSYKINDMISVAVGAQAQYIKAELTNALDFGTIDQVLTAGAFGGVPTQDDGAARVEGTDWGYGYTLGAMFQPLPGTRIGVGYRSKVSHEIDGDARFELGGSVGQGISGATGQFVATDAKASITIPEIVSFGISQEITPQWTVMAEAAWTRWSRFKELRVRFANPLQADSVTDESWRNSWFGSLGVTYKPANGWTFRGGVAYDESPIPDANRTPRIPGTDRVWIALGASKSITSNFDVSLGYTHIFLSDTPIGLTTSGTGNTFRGNISGEYESSIDIVSVQLRYRF